MKWIDTAILRKGRKVILVHAFFDGEDWQLNTKPDESIESWIGTLKPSGMLYFVKKSSYVMPNTKKYTLEFRGVRYNIIGTEKVSW